VKFSITIQSRESKSHTFLNEVILKTIRLLSFTLGIFRSMAAEVLEFFRLTEADVYIIMSAYGLHALDADHFQENQKETNKAFVDVQDRKLISEPPAPLPIGVHPEIIRQSAGAKNLQRKSAKRLLPKRLESSALATDEMLSNNEQDN
jgi:hypothetical protein